MTKEKFKAQDKIKILLELISAIYNLPPKGVILIEKEISTSISFRDQFMSPYCGIYILDGFDKNCGFEGISEMRLYKIKDITRFMFFLVYNQGYYPNSKKEWRTFTFYKAPGFQKYLSNINDTDIKRWREWIKNNNQ